MDKYKRGSGILLHITSLPSSYGVGDFGSSAYDFCDFLVETNQSYWQVLPLNPTTPVFGNSPYSSFSGFAGNPLLISPEFLVRDGYLSVDALSDIPSFPSERVDYEKALKFKNQVLNKSFDYSRDKITNDKEFNFFCSDNFDWLDDFSLYIAIREQFGEISWVDFPEEVRNRMEESLLDRKANLREDIKRQKFFQFIFFHQWKSLKKYCNEKGIKVIGDLPIYLNHDSADVWANQKIFKLDQKGRPTVVSGVPPDYFSKSGQRWGNPVYNWEVLKSSGYEWWIKRLSQNLKLFDMLRLDHFRGFMSYWEIPVNEKTAINGKWVDVPSEDFFNTVFNKFNSTDFIAEDLGEITEDVIQMRDKLDLPGMNVLQFAFGDDFPHGDFLPDNNLENSIIYTGTHDNNTTLGWWQKESSENERERVLSYIGDSFDIEKEGINWVFIELAQRSKARISILPLQDLLGLGDEAKMNKPSTFRGNWEWRYNGSMITESQKTRLKSITKKYSRD